MKKKLILLAIVFCSCMTFVIIEVKNEEQKKQQIIFESRNNTYTTPNGDPRTRKYTIGVQMKESDDAYKIQRLYEALKNQNTNENPYQQMMASNANDRNRPW